MKEVPFSTVLASLANPDQAFPARYLPRFSDLEPADLKSFQQTWLRVPLMRKRALLKNLNERYGEDTLLSYDAVATALLQDEDSVVRAHALKLLEETTDSRLIPTLVKMLETDPDQEARSRAATVLSQFVRMGEMEELPAEKRSLIENVLIKAAQGENASVARAALEALGYSGRQEVGDLIKTAFEHHDPLWQATALFAAGRTADNRWQEQVVNGLLSEDTAIRLAAVQAAGELELKAARKMLLDMLEEEADDDVFQAIIWSLSQIGGEDVRTYLEALLADTEDDDLIEYIEDALANLSFTEDMEQFDLLAVDPDDEPED